MHPTQRAPREGAERRAEAPIRIFLSLCVCASPAVSLALCPARESVTCSF